MTNPQRRTESRPPGQRGGPPVRGARGEDDLPSRNDIEKIILEGDVVTLVKWADKIGQRIKNEELSSNQIRNVFGTVRQIQLRWNKPGSEAETQAFRDAVLLQPKLGYFAEREKSSKGGRGTPGMETLEKVLVPALEMLRDSPPEKRFERFERFVEFFEAIVAYHKKHGGKS